MALTKQQIQAIEENGKNIIVSAGAGSGKTRVLTERVFDRISNNKYKWNIDEMLVLTFTNAAADNMKLRIRNKVLVNENNLLSKEEQQKQLNKIDSSFIMTFDAYAQFLVKKYHQLLNIDKNIKIIDSNIIKNKTYEIINEILLDEYKNGNNDFINLINDFCVKDDNNIRECVIEINNKLNTLSNRNEYTNNYELNYYSNNSLEERFNKYENILLNRIKTINNLLNELSNYVEDYHDYFVGIYSLLDSKNYDEIRQNINIDHSKQMRGQGEEAKLIKAEIVKELNELKDLCMFSKEELMQQIKETKNNSLYLILLANKLNNKLQEYKKENNMYEFSDIFEMANRIVDEHSDIREEIKKSFKEILIDEYQDTNDLQDEFIKKISNNNVYMVGDIKQSIYRFRNANPEIFKEKYQTYSNNKEGVALQLTSNFRSRKSVLESIDKIFNRTMDINIGGAEYEKSHKMDAAYSAYESTGKIEGQSQETEILSYPFDAEAKSEYPFTELAQSEVEAFIIAKDIEEKVKSQYKVTYLNREKDEKGNEIEVLRTRPVKYSDFAILVDRGTSFDTFKQILTFKGIPSDIYTDEKMNESDLVTVIRAAFKLICCIKDNDEEYDFKYAYMSLARSFLIEMLDTTLYDVVTNNKYKETEIYKKILKITENIETKSISNILDEFIEDFDVYNKLTKIGDIHENFVKLDYLYQLANSLNESGYNYSTFNDYLIDVFDLSNEDTIKFKIQKNNNNAVIITNIHQSKGLEYGICYYPLLTVGFNRQDIKEGIIFDKDVGLIIPSMIKDKGLKQTINKDIYKERYYKDDLSERIRLLYVALTRAKEKAILVCPLEDKTIDGKIIDDQSRLKSNSYKDLLDMIYDDLSDYIKQIDLSTYKDIFNKDYQLSTKDIFNMIPKTNEKINVKKDIIIVPTENKQSSYSKKAGLIDVETIRKMELGTKVHYYLETIDFNNPNYDLIDDKYKDLIKAFLDCEIMSNIKNGKTYKEYEFIYEENKERKHGFIDLLVEYEDHFDIVDYKSKNINDDHYDEQLNGYRKYIESITNKKVNCYLYSIVDKTYREVK